MFRVTVKMAMMMKAASHNFRRRAASIATSAAAPPDDEAAIGSDHSRLIQRNQPIAMAGKNMTTASRL